MPDDVCVLARRPRQTKGRWWTAMSFKLTWRSKIAHDLSDRITGLVFYNYNQLRAHSLLADSTQAFLAVGQPDALAPHLWHRSTRVAHAQRAVRKTRLFNAVQVATP